MIVNYNSSAVYFCPECENMAEQSISIFDFSGGKIDFRCSFKPCGKRCVTARKKKTKYIFDIECPICGETHSFPISCSGFWEKNFVSFSCPVSDNEIFFKGEREEIRKVVEEMAERNRAALEKEDLLCDMLEELYAMSAEDLIYCSCGNRHVEVTDCGSGIALLCKKCGAAKIIEASAENYRDICEAASIVITR